MSVDRDKLQEFLESVADRYGAAELIEVLEDEGFVDVWAVIAMFEEEIIEAKSKLEV